MPIYEYKCEGCGETFEVIQKFADEPVTVHEKCGGHVHRLMSAPSFQFKGSGWYVTDYAKGSGSSPAQGESGKVGTWPRREIESGKSDAGNQLKVATRPSLQARAQAIQPPRTETKNDSNLSPSHQTPRTINRCA